jgi:hypothetical protein
VPIREIGNIIVANAVWNPVYGKQLIFLSATSYFDLFFEFGLGIATSTFYPKQAQLRNGKTSRGTFPEEEIITADPDVDPNTRDDVPGASVDQTDSYGMDGRPDPESQTNELLNLGIGQKFHFAKKFHFRMDLRNLTLVGTPSGFENLFILFAGAGMRF